MQVNKIYGIIHEKFSYGFSTLIKYTCIKYLSLLLGYTDKAALNSNDWRMKWDTEDLVSLSSGLIMTVIHSVFSFSQYYLMDSKTLAVFVFMKAEDMNHW